jgi:hypothetical protein
LVCDINEKTKFSLVNLGWKQEAVCGPHIVGGKKIGQWFCRVTYMSWKNREDTCIWTSFVIVGPHSLH